MADGRMGGMADERTGWTCGRADDGFPKGKTPNLTSQLTWPSKIQHGRPRVTVKLPHLPLRSR